MDVLGDCKIKRETLVSVLRFLFSSDGVTRKEISEACGISLATAGKAADFFIASKLCTEKRSPEMKGGPRPLVITLNVKYNCTLLDLYSPDPKLYLYGINGRQIMSESYKLDTGIFPDDSLSRNLRDFDEKCRYSKPEYRFGCGVMMPDDHFMWKDLRFSGNRDSFISSVGTAVTKNLHLTRYTAVSKEKLAAEYFAADTDYCDKTVIYVCFNRNNIISAAIWNGNLIKGKNDKGLDVENVFVRKYRTLGDDLINQYDPDKTAKLCAEMCVNLIPYFDPHVIYFDSEDYYSISGLCENIRRSIRYDFGIADQLPDIMAPETGREPIFRRAMVEHLKNDFRLDIERRIMQNK